jgi:hypothetical protein
MEQEFLRIFTTLTKNYSPVTLGAATAGIILGLKIFLPYLLSASKVEIFASIAGLYRGNVIEIDAGETDKVSAGNIFTVYKKLQIRDISDERWGFKRGRYYFKPVAQLKVISTTEYNSLCKYRPIRGYSANPSVGDTVYFSNKHQNGEVLAYPAG